MAKKHRFLEQLGGDVFVDDEPENSLTQESEFSAMMTSENARSFAKIAVGDPIEAKVLGVVDGNIVCDVGQRSEGILPSEGLTPEVLATFTVGAIKSLFVSSVRNGIELSTAPKSTQGPSSRPLSVREQQASERTKILERLVIGQNVLADVVKIENFGAFIDLGAGLNALVPISEMSWSRLSSPHAVVTIGQKVSAKILKIETVGDRPRVSASMKQVEGDPWDVTVQSLEKGQVVDAKITKLMQFGAFAEITPGVEGLIHISEMSAKRRINTPGEVVQPGQTVQAKVVSIDLSQRRIGLSMKVLDLDIVEQEGKKKMEATKSQHDEHRGVELRSESPSATLSDAFAKASLKARKP